MNCILQFIMQCRVIQNSERPSRAKMCMKNSLVHFPIDFWDKLSTSQYHLSHVIYIPTA